MNPLTAARMGSQHIAWSPGWRTDVYLGSGQWRMLGILREIAAQNPRHQWHDLDALRELGWSPSTAHRLIHRLAALGLIALQVTRGCQGGIRFTFRVRRWKWTAPARRAWTRARMIAQDLAAAVKRAAAAVGTALTTFWEECVLCGYWARGSTTGLGFQCIDHEACAERVAR